MDNIAVFWPVSRLQQLIATFQKDPIQDPLRAILLLSGQGSIIHSQTTKSATLKSLANDIVYVVYCRPMNPSSSVLCINLY